MATIAITHQQKDLERGVRERGVVLRQGDGQGGPVGVQLWIIGLELLLRVFLRIPRSWMRRISKKYCRRRWNPRHGQVQNEQKLQILLRAGWYNKIRLQRKTFPFAYAKIPQTPLSMRTSTPIDITGFINRTKIGPGAFRES